MAKRAFHLVRQAWAFARSKPVTWFDDRRVAACRYPREADLRALANDGVRLLISLHERPYPPDRLASLGVRCLHLPVADFTPPSPAQLAQGVAAIEAAVAAGERVAIHCGGGLGRTGTLLACYLVRGGMSAEAAIAHVRARRPGSIETPAQVAAVHAFAEYNRTLLN